MLIFNQFASNPIFGIVVLIALIIALTVHEYAHAWVANYYGDNTAKLMGRLTLNPLAHLDLLGTIFIVIAGFGWGKPVIVNPNNFENPKLDNLTVSLAGPISNLALGIIFGLILRFAPVPAVVIPYLEIFIFYNLVLMIFNLIPIPPLDGSKMLAVFLSEQTYMVLQQVGIPILFALILFSSFIPVIPLLMTKAVGLFFTIITGRLL